MTTSPTEQVTLSFTREEQIELASSESPSSTWKADGQFVCQAGHVILRRPPHWLGNAFGAGRTSVTLELFSVDDYLVVKEKEHTFMLASFIVPMTHSTTGWYRFERATKTPDVKRTP